MERVAFCLRLHKGMGEAYDEAHRKVWPEMMALLKRAGISEYSIFRRDELLVLSMRADNFDRAWNQIEQDPINKRWQQTTAPYFEAMEPLRPGERFPMMQEVFYMK
jgi:L-rhamnose mutarotase